MGLEGKGPSPILIYVDILVRTNICVRMLADAVLITSSICAVLVGRRFDRRRSKSW